jgi:DNA-binding transcriptional regulator YiaG
MLEQRASRRYDSCMARKRKKPEPESVPTLGTPETMPAGDDGWPEWLRAMRDRLGLTQTAAAELLWMQQNSWSMWESGERVPDGSRRLLLWQLASGKLVQPPKK